MTNRLMKTQRGELLLMAPLCATLLLAGCGGSGGNATPGGGATSSTIGEASVKYFGTPHAEVEGVSGQVAVTGQAGASYSTISVNPTPNLASTSLIYTRSLSGPGDQIFVSSPTGGGTPRLLVHGSNNGYVSVSQPGVVSFLTELNSLFDIETILIDGSSQKTSLTNRQAFPTISPNGGTIAFIDTTLDIYTMPAGGGTIKQIYTGGNAASAPVVWSPTGSEIAFTATNSVTGFLNVYTISSNGGTATDVTPVAYATGDTVVSGWSPDGQTLACTFLASGGSVHSMLTISLAGGFSNTISQSTFNDATPCFSPDNLEIAFYRDNTGGATPGIYVTDFVGTNPQLVIPDPGSTGTTGSVQNMVWSPFLQNKTFVGTGGNISSSAVSGFLLSQNSSQFASLVTFTATTPSKATITPPTGITVGGPMLYTLGADAITNISFTNTYNGAHTSLNLTTTPTAIVSIDGVTGLVDFLAAGTIQKKSPPPSKGSSLGLTYTGRFTAIYDGNGTNLAPSGATTLEVDPKSGKLLSFH